jgi:hypothetical protein
MVSLLEKVLYLNNEGKLQEPTGKYEGEFLNGKKHGNGIYYYEHKLRYEG